MVASPGVRQGLSSRWQILLVLLSFTFAYLVSELVRNVNGVLAPTLRRDFALTAFDLGLLTAAFLAALAGAQLVVGVLLDRYGPKRVVVATMGVAALASIGFALAQDPWQLMLARFMMGIGLCACWTGAYKANALWWPAERLPLVNAVTISLASLGSLLATWPTEAALTLVSWRWLFVALGGVVAAMVLFMLLVVPRHPQEAREEDSRWCDQVDGMFGVACGRAFLVVAPLSFVAQGVWIAYQGLWAGEWLREAAGWSEGVAAAVLTGLALSLVIGQMAFGIVADRLTRSDRALFRMTALLCAAFIAAQIVLVIRSQGVYGVVWAAWGALTAGPILGYALLTRLVSPSVSPALFTRVPIGRSEGAGGQHRLSGLAFPAREAAESCPGTPFLSAFYSAREPIMAVQAAVIADRHSGRSMSDAVVVSQERQLSAVNFGSPFSREGQHLSAAAPR